MIDMGSGKILKDSVILTKNIYKYWRISCPTLPDTNELEFSKIQEIENSETDRPVFMLNLNKYFDKSGFIN